MVELRDFTQADWRAFPGVECDDPKIGEGRNYVVITYARGVDVFLEGASEDSYYLFKCSPSMASIVAQGLPEELDRNKLLALGFKEL